ncbi:hypothetical protein OH76DRAFT_680989 [Lentinus brumalis]|uniref:Uncharacterized protein n=1 Tax=Lentinus brumalis TaxID=2498619 RepID=A0A371D6K9_9APHY|nr:hypothetical protein OH76DRAFT_680989 [Polyporus brumalis]
MSASALVALVEVNLATVCVQSALYGVFFVLAVTSLVVLIARHKREHAPSQLPTGTSQSQVVLLGLWKSPLFIATVILLLTITANWCLIVYRAFQAFIHFQGGTNPAGFYIDVANPTALTLNAIPTVTVVTCDSMVIYRTWVIWNRRNAVAVLPTLTTISLTVCSIMIVFIIGKDKSTQSPNLTPWLYAAYTLTFMYVVSPYSGTFTVILMGVVNSNNIYGTGMIVYKITAANRALRRVGSISGGMKVQGTLGILIESAALYASWTLFFFITYLTKSTVNALANDCFPPVSGIALMLITVRVGLGWAHSAGGSQQVSGTSFIRSAFSRPERGPRESLPMHAISLKVSTTVERETDYGLETPGTDHKSPGESLKDKDDHGFAV